MIDDGNNRFSPVMQSLKVYRLKPFRVNIFRESLFFSFCFFVPGSAKAITVYIQNKLNQTEPGAVLEVTKVKGIGVSLNQKQLVMPGEKKRVNARHVTAFTLSRVFGDHKLMYEIRCPEDVRIKDVLTVGLEEIEKNAIGAGCELFRKGRWSLETGAQWEEKKK